MTAGVVAEARREGRVTRLDPSLRDARREIEVLAWLLDSSIRVPIIGRRFGLDGLIGLVPGVGDLVSTALALLIVARASRHRLPRVVIARMLLNVGIDALVGAVPLAGDAFDLWFKANLRNLDLFRRYAEEPRQTARRERLILVGIAVVVLLGLALVAWAVAALVGELAGLVIGA